MTKIVDLFQLLMQLTFTSISLAWISAFIDLSPACIDSDVLILFFLIFMMLGCLSVYFCVFIHRVCVSFKFYFQVKIPLYAWSISPPKSVCLQLSRLFLSLFSLVLSEFLLPRFYCSILFFIVLLLGETLHYQDNINVVISYVVECSQSGS